MPHLSHLNPTTFGPAEWIYVAWSALALVWFAFWFTAKRPAHVESRSDRWSHLIFLFIGAFLLMRESKGLFGLGTQIIPNLPWIGWTGAGLALFGSAFAIWARLILGTNWSAEVQIKEGHTLIRRGPYKFIRHPIYTGILLIIVGDALAIGELRAILAFFLILIGFARKAKKEESYLSAEFGPAFDEHVRHTGFFLPRFS